MRYKQSYTNLSRNEEQFNAVVGISLAVFAGLSTCFEQQLSSYEQHFAMNGQPRKRALSRRKDNIFSSANDKLCFILSYLKNNALQQSHASNWGMLQPQANIWIHYLSGQLLTSLEGMALVPASESGALAELLKEVKKIYLDGTERSIQRPLHKEEQKRHYSGKKNTYH
jgi:hypothetical protein